MEAWKQTVVVPTVLAAGVEELAATAVVEEAVEPTCEIEGLVAAEEARIVVAETWIRTEAWAAGTRTAGVMPMQLLVSSSTAPENWESA